MSSLRWLAVSLPRWPLDALGLPASASGRVVLDAQRRVCAADDTAAAAGVRPGQAVASALALCAGLQVHAREPLRDAALLHGLALSLSRFTPQLALRGDDGGVLLDVGASLRLFGGPRALVTALREVLREHGVHTQLGAAPTPLAAWWFAQVPAAAAAWRARLDALPLRVLAAEPRVLQLLQGIGARRLGDLRALPRAGLQRRGGAAVLAQLDRAYGDVPDPQPWFEPPLHFALDLELVERADDAAMLAFAAQRLVQALAGWLGRQWCAATAFSLWLQHETSGRHAHPPTRLRIELGQPSRDAAQLMGLLRERLQRLPLPAPVYGIKLQLDSAQPLAGHEGRLWPDANQRADELRALLDRLSARLGAERVSRWSLRADHRPEHAAVAWPAVGAPPADAVSAAPPLPRPAWLLPEPLPLAEQGGRPLHGGQPLLLCSPPERIEAGWHDGELICRDYHVAEGSDHQLRWIFRERLNDGSARWYLHGLFG